MFASRITSLRARLAARLARTLLVGGVAIAAVATAACSSDRLTAPVSSEPAARSDALISTVTGTVTSTTTTLVTTAGNALFSKKALLRTTALAAPITRSITLYHTGGTLSIPEAGVTLHIPRIAIGNERITISMTALPGKAVAYHFEPHGLRFKSSVKLTQALVNTTWYGSSGRAVLGGGYFASDSQINLHTGLSALNELLPATLTGSTVHLNINHFSGYMVSMD